MREPPAKLVPVSIRFREQLDSHPHADRLDTARNDNARPSQVPTIVDIKEDNKVKRMQSPAPAEVIVTTTVPPPSGIEGSPKSSKASCQMSIKSTFRYIHLRLSAFNAFLAEYFQRTSAPLRISSGQVSEFLPSKYPNWDAGAAHLRCTGKWVDIPLGANAIHFILSGLSSDALVPTQCSFLLWAR
ncbi:hypothetical protein BJ508DRAFT_309797 [Ascobolus immersus RN42]|uniref:Uncharacterized protein n=1 Tax=Ascobolus immersus RN42 TaxID=1160509 RepID=A0A3N4HXK0_ASCIM|nr:hypothetical protein BJ508DRAFT_309797 [Ascobolus immersus RN42]